MRLARPVQLGADAGVVGRQRAIRQAGPEAPDIALELRGFGGIDRIVLGHDIAQVRPEHGLSAQVLAIVGAERTGDGRRIDQPLERGLAGQPEIDPLAEMARRYAVCGIPLNPGGYGLRAEAGGRNQQSGGQGGSALPARRDPEAPAGQRLRPLERGREHHRATRGPDLTLKGQHIAVAVEDPTLGRQDGGMGVEARLERPGLRAREMLQPLDAVGGGLDEDGLDPLDLSVVGRDDQLAAFAIVDLVAVEKGIERAPSLDTEPRLQ